MKNKSKENLELLQQAIECGILGSDSVLDILMATKRERVKKDTSLCNYTTSERGRTLADMV